jgi:hypothetical protein
MKNFFFIMLLALLGAAPAFADVTVASPASNATIGTPFVLNATASPCSGQPVSAMGYSLDAGATTTFSNVTSLNVQVTAPTGAHTLHVKSWGNKGAACTANVPVTVSTSVAAPLYTDAAVSQPTGLNSLVSPFTLIASGTQCKSQPITAFGWSIDSSSNTTIVNGSSMNTPVTSPLGAHTLHVKSWGNAGASCVNDVAVNVVPDPASTVPSSAIAVQSIQNLTNWVAELDTATGNAASATGTFSLTNTPSMSGSARQFATTTSNYGGERYHIGFGADTAASNFLYDGWVYLGAGAANIANLEFDLNQVTANGQTVIYGFQCDSWSKTWDYTGNAGTATAPNDTWVHSNQPCNLANWTPNTWHHVQISYSRDNSGNVTYKSVWLDGVQQDLNATVFSSFALGWSPTLLTNFQVDGNTTAPSNSAVYLDNLTIYRW